MPKDYLNIHELLKVLDGIGEKPRKLADKERRKFARVLADATLDELLTDALQMKCWLIMPIKKQNEIRQALAEKSEKLLVNVGY